MMRIYRPPRILRWLYHHARFRIGDKGKTLYLTFDDGPTEGVTGLLLDILIDKGVPATFFVTGENVTTNPDLFKMIVDSGFSTGNHGFRHLNGARTSFSLYMDNADKGSQLSGSNLFRPPYGMMRPCHYIALRRKYTIILWDLLPYDFDRSLSDSAVLGKMKNFIRPGSIVAMHDNINSSSVRVLPEFIDYCRAEGYQFADLADS